MKKRQKNCAQINSDFVFQSPDQLAIHLPDEFVPALPATKLQHHSRLQHRPPVLGQSEDGKLQVRSEASSLERRGEKGDPGIIPQTSAFLGRELGVRKNLEIL